MKINYLIKVLEKMRDDYGDNINVVMADNIPVVKPIFLDEYPHGKKIILTDE